MATSDYEVIFAFPNGDEEAALVHDVRDEAEARTVAARTLSRRYDEDDAATFEGYIVEVHKL